MVSKSNFAKLSFIFTVVLLVALAVAGTALANQALTIPLNNDTAQVGTDCPADGGAYWHFVISPNNDQSAFVVFHLNLGDATTYDVGKFLQNGTQWDNVFVALPQGKTLQSLIKDNSTAEIVWTEKGNTPDKFQLSHLCPGSAPKDLTVSKTAKTAFTRTFGWTLAKSADQTEVKTADAAKVKYTVSVTKDAGTDSDWALSGTITVHNPNTFAVSGVNITDPNCDVANGANLTVPAGGDISATYTCALVSNPGSGTNTATASWPAFGSPSTSATGSTNYTFGNPTTLVNDSITVTDTNGSAWDFNASGSVSYPMTYTDPAGTCTDHVNTVTTKYSETSLAASATVKVCVGADLTVSKTANPSFTRTYKWDISKSVDKTLVKQVGGSALFNYTVKAWQVGFVDSAWAVSGKIMVSNPNDWEAITANVTDALPGAICNVTGGTGVVVAASSSKDVSYSCSFAAQPAYNTDLTNTATADWGNAYTPSTSASGSAKFQFTAPTKRINSLVTVTDTFNGTTTTLGTLTALDAAPFASAEYKYARSIAMPAYDCLSYANVASITETGQSAGQTVKVCGPAKTGALTMGFWQNKNGQAIITGGAATNGVCNSATWLRQFAPFQDLSATASCSAVATYTLNVIKAANASGSSMNAMLKAQMLATALDVYFSDPALGGNKIGAPAPIGGVSVDLTLICTDLSCAAYENSSSVFGGSPKTVLQMLTYAASQSNAGGDTWYGNVKSTQELAKDAFDAINNQKVFSGQ